MSFDLFFCWQRHERIDFGAVRAWAKGLPCFEQKESQLWYQNEDTGVYFSLGFEGQPAEKGEGPEIPQGYSDTGLSFNLNFNRPSYFGHEAMPIVADLAAKFGLSVVDPQARDPDHLLVRDAKSKDLLESWLQNNRNAILTMLEHADLATPIEMTLPKSLYRWNYAKNKKNLEAKCGEDIFVPTLSPVRRTASNRAELAFVCSQGVPCLVPTSDWVFIVRTRKEHFWSGKETEVGVMSERQFRDSVAGKLETFDSELSLELLPPKLTVDVGKLLQTCEFEFPREEFEILALDGFVDIEFGLTAAPN
jgi:hypothetical protein